MLWLRDLFSQFQFPSRSGLFVSSLLREPTPGEPDPGEPAPGEHAPGEPDLKRLGEAPDAPTDGGKIPDLTPFALRAHGPCSAGAEPIAVHKHGLPAKIVLDLRYRQHVGFVKYGQVLRYDWPEADIALYQELLDAVQYALTGRRPVLARVLAYIALFIRLRIERTHGGTP
jgi:hypothetical protein